MCRKNTVQKEDLYKHTFVTNIILYIVNFGLVVIGLTTVLDNTIQLLTIFFTSFTFKQPSERKRQGDKKTMLKTYRLNCI